MTTATRTHLALFALTALLAVASTGCGCGAGALTSGAPCDDDSDCADDATCVAGRCQPAGGDGDGSIGTKDSGVLVGPDTDAGPQPPDGADPCGIGNPCAEGVCIGGYCQDDPCSSAAADLCLGGATCVATCVDLSDPCTNVECPDAQTCFQGQCVSGCFPPSPCLGVTCEEGSFCSSLTGLCQPLNSCESYCPGGSACHLTCASANPCAGVVCADGERCVRGSCVLNRCANVDCSGTEICINGACLDTCDCGSTDCDPGFDCQIASCACVPQCPANARCGEPDGCDGTCQGICPEGTGCQGVGGGNFDCVCQPNCTTCGGPDGCGNTCTTGTCPGGGACQGGTCCTPDCAGKSCGDANGCGGECDVEDCTGAQEACVNVGGGNYACRCQADCSGKSCGDADGCGGTCTGCPSGQVCDSGACCTPDCTNAICGGSDGCGGTCNGPCAEDCNSCAADCGSCSGAHCGNGTCDSGAGESCSNCRADCGTCSGCGNGNCEGGSGEDRHNCPEDCGYSAPSCGDGVCQTGLSQEQCRRSRGQYQCRCIGSCSGKSCGELNGCGGECRIQDCPNGQSCQSAGGGSYTCQCQPSCAGKACLADDGCGGACATGVCNTGEFCTPDDCQPDPCNPSCGCGEQCINGACVAACNAAAGEAQCGCNDCCDTTAGEYCNPTTQQCETGGILD